ncbi:hypothetical protein RISK_005135 [Rhodopirellula islandica]|uniref:Uncharacterized protein n=1 Tax=Rhodopirellula islandica TaxID=595434 RepID=A0A0J1EB74_RHOIS|nr:hypothetical protein [Rhodopirellula islandica]KLU02839.1 hypothetical protein RISK_005135 [Rhodopirellula islandica]
MTHRIRLRRPWTREIFRDGQSLHRAERVHVPDASANDEVSMAEVSRAESGKGDQSSAEYHAIYRRHFNCPTGLEESDQLSIEIIPALKDHFVVRLNEVVIGSGGPAGAGQQESNLLPVPQPRKGQNQIEIELRAQTQSDLPRCVAEVALRIDAAS